MPAAATSASPETACRLTAWSCRSGQNVSTLGFPDSTSFSQGFVVLRSPTSLSVLLFAGTFLTFPLAADDEWPQFQGPSGNGHSTAKGLSLTWSETENVVWKVPDPGGGHSSPVISGQDIWLTTAVETKLTAEQQQERLAKVKNSRGLEIAGGLSLRAVCLDRDSGKLRHSIELFQVVTPEPIHALNSYASPSPILENGKLFCHFGTYGTCCIATASGQVEWRNTEHHVDHQNGPGASPSLWQNVIILNFDGIDRQYVAGLDKRTGETLWTVKRSGKMPDRAEFRKTYSTATVLEDPRGAQVISPGADWVYSYDPASGRELWRAGLRTARLFDRSASVDLEEPGDSDHQLHSSADPGCAV